MRLFWVLLEIQNRFEIVELCFPESHFSLFGFPLLQSTHMTKPPLSPCNWMRHNEYHREGFAAMPTPPLLAQLQPQLPELAIWQSPAGFSMCLWCHLQEVGTSMQCPFPGGHPREAGENKGSRVPQEGQCLLEMLSNAKRFHERWNRGMLWNNPFLQFKASCGQEPIEVRSKDRFRPGKKKIKKPLQCA